MSQIIGKNIIETALYISKNMKDKCQGRNKHFSFIFKKNNLMSIGYNNQYKTHPLAYKLDYYDSSVHSELSSIISYSGSFKDLSNCILLNTRVNSNNELGQCCPCDKCMQWIGAVGFKNIFHLNSKTLAPIKVKSVINNKHKRYLINKYLSRKLK